MLDGCHVVVCDELFVYWTGRIQGGLQILQAHLSLVFQYGGNGERT